MKIEADDKEVQDIFSLGYYKIPRFQRPYSWSIDEVSSFWNDIMQASNDPYFIGSMVVYQERKPYFGVVDGQQRLTTITLILAAIRNCFIALKDEDLAKGIQNFVVRPNVDNKDEFILNSETSFPYLQTHIQGYNGLQVQCDVGSEEENLKTAFDYIVTSLNIALPRPIAQGDVQQLELFSYNDKEPTIAKLKEVRDKVLSLKLVFIQLDNEDDAYLIFETLNARGRDLTTSDLVKNHLLKKLKSKTSTHDSAKLMWNRIVKRFDDAGFKNGMDQFLYHFWLSGRQYVTDKKLFSELKDSTNDVKSAEGLLEELQVNSEYYLSMIAPRTYKWRAEETRVAQSLIALERFTVKQQSSMVLALMRAYREKKLSLKMLTKAMEEIEFFHFVFNAVTSQRSSGSIATNYSTHAIKLANATEHAQVQSTLRSLKLSLKERLPSYNEFEANFIELNYTSRRTKNKPVVKYALQKFLGDRPSGLSVDYDSMSIEHLLPEDRMTSPDKDEEVGNIGNLLLIDKTTNSEDLTNLDFRAKKELLIKMGYPLDPIILSASEWTSDTIRRRAEYLANETFDKSVLD